MSIKVGRSPLRARRAFVGANGLGPWPCGYCGRLVYKFGKDSSDGHVHHVDGDVTNDHPSNLDVMHAGCHMKFHKLGEVHTAEHNAKVGRPGRAFTSEWRMKLSARQRTRVRCSECDYVSSPQWVGIHRKRYHG